MTQTVRVIGTTGSNLFPTVNIIAVDPNTPDSHVYQRCTQLTAAQAAPFNMREEVKTVQTSNAVTPGASGPIPTNGLKTIIIPAYTGTS